MEMAKVLAKQEMGIKEVNKVTNFEVTVKEVVLNTVSVVNVFLTNLGKYNEGSLVGKWVSLPCDDIQGELESIGVKDNTEYEEYFITDWETEYSGIQISEYSNIDELNEVAEKLADVDNMELVNALIDEFGYNIDDAIDKAEDVLYLQLDTTTCMSDDENLAYTYIEHIGDLECAVGDRMSYYFNYESFGRDLSYDLDFEDEDYKHLTDLTDEELAYWYIDNCIGDIELLGRETLESYFDYESYGRDLSYDFTINHDSMLAICNY